MSAKLNESLEALAHSAGKGDSAVTGAAIQAARVVIKNLPPAAGDRASLLQQLDQELSTWQGKLDVILSEPVGRQGMAKHARFWIEQISKGNACQS